MNSDGELVVAAQRHRTQKCVADDISRIDRCIGHLCSQLPPADAGPRISPPRRQNYEDALQRLQARLVAAERFPQCSGRHFPLHASPSSARPL